MPPHHWPWCSPSSSRTRWSTPSRPSSRGLSGSAAPGRATDCGSPSRTTAWAYRSGSAWRRRPAWGCRSCSPSWGSWAVRSAWDRAERTPGPASRCGSRTSRHGRAECSGSGAAHPRTCVAALQRASLVLAEAAPDTVVLPGLEGPCEALFAHVAASAHLLRLLDLKDRGAGVADREEQFRVLVEARGTVSPIHGWGNPPNSFVNAFTIIARQPWVG